VSAAGSRAPPATPHRNVRFRRLLKFSSRRIIQRTSSSRLGPKGTCASARRRIVTLSVCAGRRFRIGGQEWEKIGAGKTNAPHSVCVCGVLRLGALNNRRRALEIATRHQLLCFAWAADHLLPHFGRIQCWSFESESPTQTHTHCSLFLPSGEILKQWESLVVCCLRHYLSTY
jgi:hypothetical protein